MRCLSCGFVSVWLCGVGGFIASSDWSCTFSRSQPHLRCIELNSVTCLTALKTRLLVVTKALPSFCILAVQHPHVDEARRDFQYVFACVVDEHDIMARACERCTY